MGAAAMPIAMIATAAGGIYSAKKQGDIGLAQQDYYNYLAGNAKTNAKLAEMAGAAESESLGMAAYEQYKGLREGQRRTIGAQKVALAAGGAGLSSKTAEQLIGETVERGAMDEAALEYNAEMKRRSIQIGTESQRMNLLGQAGGYGMAGSQAAQAARIGQFSTILGTGGSVAKDWYAWKRTT